MYVLYVHICVRSTHVHTYVKNTKKNNKKLLLNVLSVFCIPAVGLCSLFANP